MMKARPYPSVSAAVSGRSPKCAAAVVASTAKPTIRSTPSQQQQHPARDQAEGAAHRERMPARP
ncbi:hypothetical protein [Nonomuraea helvata]|uniref:Uncharacterized protein n=1 Tax=Nonomuraea helvata TaxID=37484 RepID=A0ABV5SK97_9ACTN